ncbi:MAG: hypothetical protein AB1414_15295 [bacterium]
MSLMKQHPYQYYAQKEKDIGLEMEFFYKEDGSEEKSDSYPDKNNKKRNIDEVPNYYAQDIEASKLG